MSNNLWYAIGINEHTGYIGAASSGNYEFAKDMAADYRKSGFLSRILSAEEFEEISSLTAAERRARVASDR